MLKLYGHPLSGNAYKVKLLLSMLDLNYENIDVALEKGEHRQPPFLALNPFGQVPVLADGDTVIADAQAILVYLARQYGGEHSERWLPLAPLSMAEVMRWLSTTAGEVRQGPESARLYHLFKVSTIDIERTMQKAGFILQQLDQHLAQQDWLACGHPTIADIAVFPYVALSADGQIDLSGYVHVMAWIERMKQLPKFVGMRGIG
ncbi:MAG: glutathione S-transferase family protein [Cyanobacteria bacterium J06623_4]